MLYIVSRLCTCFHELHSQLSSQCFSLLRGNHSSFFNVAFVAHKDFIDTFTGVLFNVLAPILDVSKALFISYIVYKHNSHCSSIVGYKEALEEVFRAKSLTIGDCFEALLPSSVPNLEFCTLSTCIDGFDFEVDSHSGDEGRSEGIVAKAQEKAAFSHSTITYKKQFDEKVVIWAFDCTRRRHLVVRKKCWLRGKFGAVSFVDSAKRKSGSLLRAIRRCKVCSLVKFHPEEKIKKLVKMQRT